MNAMRVLISALMFGLALTSARAANANWPHWRGPAFDGSSPETGLPATFSKTEGLAWSVLLPGPAAATPIVWNDRVFISSVDADKGTLVALCFDRQTGKKRWAQEVASGTRKDDRSNYASSSPVTDGHRVIFFYGNGDLVAFDLDGQKLWARNLQKDYGSFAFLWTFSASPTLWGDKLFLQVLQRNVPVHGRGREDGPNDSYLLALDPATGRELWKHIRPSDAVAESREAFSTPLPFAARDRTELLVAGGDCLTAHDPASGREYWRWGTWNPSRISHWRLVPSPVAAAGVALACAPKGGAIYAVKTGAQGVLDDTGLAWKSQNREVSSDVSTPLFYKGRFYVVNSDRRSLACVQPDTGEAVWVHPLDSRAKIEASPSGADDKIYIINHWGDVFVVAAADEFKLLHTTALGGDEDRDVRASIAVAHGQLFIRTARYLYCVGR
jgi:outer membrane protein assembly factor BamB